MIWYIFYYKVWKKHRTGQQTGKNFGQFEINSGIICKKCDQSVNRKQKNKQINSENSRKASIIVGTIRN